MTSLLRHAAGLSCTGFVLLLLLVGCSTAPPSPDKPVAAETPVIETTKKPEPETRQAALPETPTETVIDERPKTEILTIGVMLPLQGQEKAVGQQILNGIEMALHLHGPDRLTIIPYDTQGRRFSALGVARQAISDNVDLVLGPLFSANVRAIRPLLARAGIPMLSFSNDLNLLEDNTTARQTGNPDLPTPQKQFILGLNQNNEVEELLDQAIASGRKNFALIAPGDSFGLLVEGSMHYRLHTEPDAQFIRTAFYNNDEVNFQKPVQEISNYEERHQAYLDEVELLKESGITEEDEIEVLMNFQKTVGEVDFDAIIIVCYSDNVLRTLAAQLEYYDVDPEKVQFLGMRHWQGFDGLNRENSLLNAWYTGFDRQRFNRFNTAFRRLYGRDATHFAAIGFDIMTIVSRYGRRQETLFAALNRPEGFVGSLGAFRFTPQGSIDRKFTLYQIKRRGVRVKPPVTRVRRNWRIPAIRYCPCRLRRLARLLAG